MNSQHKPSDTRYESMIYRRAGNSGLLLPAISLGLWHNFGDVDNQEVARDIILHAFDNGITHFDLANNYGPPPGTAEINFGNILRNNLAAYRDEIIISNKAGYTMWPGPYGDWGSRKYIIASCDQSLKRTGVDYFDIFYSHRPDPDTPLEETMAALSHLVKQGKALYIGISRYSPEQTQRAAQILQKMGTPCLIHQPKYSMFIRDPEEGLLDVLGIEGIGSIVFSPLAQGLLTDRYLKGIPDNSRAARSSSPFLKKTDLTDSVISKVRRLNDMAAKRDQRLSQMAIAWLLKDERVTSVLIGASSVDQLKINLGAISNIKFTKEELSLIENILSD